MYLLSISLICVIVKFSILSSFIEITNTMLGYISLSLLRMDCSSILLFVTVNYFHYTPCYFNLHQWSNIESRAYSVIFFPRLFSGFPVFLSVIHPTRSSRCMFWLPIRLIKLNYYVIPWIKINVLRQKIPWFSAYQNIRYTLFYDTIFTWYLNHINQSM